MKLKTTTRSRTIFRIAALWAACSPVWAQPAVTNLEIQGENWVAYFHDIFDFAQMASNPNIAIPLRPGKPFQSFTDITDIVAVNGKPAKGVWINRGSAELKLKPNAVAGAAMAIADVNRLAMVNHYLEILQPDGTPIGTITAAGMNFGNPPPGSPANILRNNVVVTGGTGAFFGARGQAGNGPDSLGVNARVTSISEDPANRRLNGGGSHRFVISLVPMFRPEIVLNPSGPAVLHANDFTPVSAVKPAKGGEPLTLFATGLGPTRPGVDPGQPFTADPRQVVNSPLEVLVNGKAGEVLYAGGYPGAVDRYQVNFRVPEGTVSGQATV